MKMIFFLSLHFSYLHIFISPPLMKVSIIRKAVLPGIPSASGCEVVEGIIYIIGDDSANLYKLDHGLKLLETISLFESPVAESGRIPKKIKPDFECFTNLKINSNDYLLVLGSGSKSNRNKGYLVKMPTRFNKKHVVQELDLGRLYNFLSTNPDIVGNDGELNLEAAAADEEHMILFNRANTVGQNTALIFSLEEFIVYMTENEEMVPFPSVVPFTLPAIDGVACGFSGAGIMDGKLFFTASAEDTSDAYLDGEVKGSLIGYIPLQVTEYLRGGNYQKLTKELYSQPVYETDGSLYKGKIESISVFEKDSDTKYAAVAVTDDDKGGSELLLLELEI